MIQVFADGNLTYDSRLEDYDLLGLQLTKGLNKGGTAELIMPPGHPAYTSFRNFKSIVEVYRNRSLRFRGRVLYLEDDFYNQRKIVCEGELCFFQDAVSRPYLYQTDPAAIFTDLVGKYNSQVESVKRFRVGTITVTDPNNYIRLESENAESVLDSLKKLLERCGGYILFSTAADGVREVNWYAALNSRSRQVIEFGENLLSFSRSGANTDLATVVEPYGAKNSETGERVTIASVNGGKNYIADEEAVALYGWIARPVYWDDVTEPANLLTKARSWLDEHRNIITSLRLTALDLSYMDKNIDSFQEGDLIRVRSRPHGVDDDFLLTERTENLLHPETSTIDLGKHLTTLTGAGVAVEAKSSGTLQSVVTQLRSDYAADTEALRSQIDTVITERINDYYSRLLVFGQNGTSIGIGAAPTRTNALEVALNMYDRFGAYIGNGLSLRSTSEIPIDANTTIEHLVLTDVNTPNKNLWYVSTLFDAEKSISGNRRQTAFPHQQGGQSFTRYFISGEWSPWESEQLRAWPVGSIYLAYNHTDPGTLFGGTWERIQNAFLWATDAQGIIGVTAGEKEVTLSEEQMPAHTHEFSNRASATTGDYWNAPPMSSNSGIEHSATTVVKPSGGGKPHNNMPPYIQISVWRRTE